MSEQDGKERCARCGDVDHDRRTLWMACFYAMNELSIPFEEKVLFHADPDTLEKTADPVSIEVGGVVGKINLEAGRMRSTGELSPMRLFTLRVCKDCRGEWLHAIEDWFRNVSREESCGSGIFVRENGRNVEITREEWDQRNPGREPIVLR